LSLAQSTLPSDGRLLVVLIQTTFLMLDE